MRALLDRFFRDPPASCGAITNERSLQLELGMFLRSEGYGVDFERSIKAPRLEGATLPPKHNLDLLVKKGDCSTGIELKVPLNGQHPETMYAFCADLEFLESIKRLGAIAVGYAIMLTPDKAFWSDSGRGSAIHNLFRQSGSCIGGEIAKPTGAPDTCVLLEGRYEVAGRWSESSLLMKGSRFLVVQV